MAHFNLYSELQNARMKVSRKEGTETIRIQRPFYTDVLEVDCGTTHYTIVREGLIVRGAKIYREKEYIGKVEEKVGFMSHFDVFLKARRVFAIEERETLIKQHFDILKQGKVIGHIRPIGVYVPILSNLGKGVEGDYSGITKDEEEILLMGIVALGV